MGGNPYKLDEHGLNYLSILFEQIGFLKIEVYHTIKFYVYCIMSKTSTVYSVHLKQCKENH